jgi:hypothetical protein
MNHVRKPDQHYVRSVGDCTREEISAHIRRAIRELERIEASLPPVLIDGESRQRGTAHNYLTNVVPRVAEAAFDCTLNIAELAASLGNDETFDAKKCRAGFKDILDDELFDAKQWADERETEDA